MQGFITVSTEHFDREERAWFPLFQKEDFLWGEGSQTVDRFPKHCTLHLSQNEKLKFPLRSQAAEDVENSSNLKI